MNIGSIDVGIEKPIEIQILVAENIEKPIEKSTKAQVHIEILKLVITEKPKPLLVEMKTQPGPPEDNASKLVTNTESIEIVKVVGQTSGTSLSEFKPTNVTKVLLDSIKKRIDCNTLAYKAIDDTIPILKMIASKCNIDHVKDSLSQLDTLSKFIAGNVITVDKVNEDTFKEKMEKEK